jgi:hypothetical protein
MSAAGGCLRRMLSAGCTSRARESARSVDAQDLDQRQCTQLGSAIRRRPNDDPSDDPYYNDHQVAGAAMFDLAGQLENFAYFWHYDIVGGTPNDVVGVTADQYMPGSTGRPLTGPSHFEETAFTGVKLQAELNLMTNR